MNFFEKIIFKIRPAFLASFIKKIIFHKRVIFNSAYGNFFIDKYSSFGNDLLEKGFYEQEMINTLRKNLSKKDSFIDLGANEGFFSVIASKIVGKEGNIYSIEPQSRLQNIILKNLELNNIKNTKLFQVAISDKEETTNLYLSPDINTGSSGLYNSQKYKIKTESIKTTTLKNFFSENKLVKIKLLKIDVEGYEYEAILSSKSLFENQIIENIALELHDKVLVKRGKDILHITKFLEGCGYSVNKDYTTLVYSVNS